MEEKFFLHRIKKQEGAYNKGIEVHDTLDDAVRSYHGQMKLAYNGNPDITFVQCFITDGAGQIVRPYAATWLKEPEAENVYFLHYIRKDGETYTKNIDVCDLDAASQSFHAQMEYGYDNTRFPNVSFVSCQVTDLLSGGMILVDETWNKAETEPEEETGTEE